MKTDSTKTAYKRFVQEGRFQSKQVDRRRQIQHGGLVAHDGGHIVSNGEGESV